MFSEVTVCSSCVMDSTDPNISFDADGVCNHCHEAKVKLEQGWFPGDEGRQQLEAISNEIRQHGKGREYDCIIGVSGGVDSSYLLHVAKHEMKLRPLVVHVDAGWNSEIAVKNIEQLVKALDLDLFTYVVNWEEMQDLQLSFLKASVANQDIPQDHSFFAKLYDYAAKNDIKYIINGSNLTSESILPQSWGYDASDLKHILGIHKQFGTKKLKTYPKMNFFMHRVYWPYVKKMKIVRPLNLIDFDKNKAIKFLEENYGWRYYGGKHHESKWTKFFQAYYLPEKFGFDKRKAHLSSMIASAQITREQALAELTKPLYDESELVQDKRYIARKLAITDEEFDNLLSLPNKDYSDYPNQISLLNGLRNVKRIVRK
ncbi:N-acetyl sugar amidotransferase [Glaciecola sp. XM2]|uniref:N-acetyl sugar amidotransferase n=1 Tax=Glaciecola sp. XM2 TaxID=1914931 RepID=UPI001BDE84E9|nr:N-acetyl sugar amidotransferase [Glaciecola sp. XM2]MBT1450699.1 N-acetyl sugar amidotransferase [Glaciecola sp. XM2]